MENILLFLISAAVIAFILLLPRRVEYEAEDRPFLNGTLTEYRPRKRN